MRRQAASTRSLLTCARASSQTSARGFRALGGPVPEAEAEPVRHRADLQGTKQFSHGVVPRRQSGGRWEHDVVAVAQLPARVVEPRQCIGGHARAPLVLRPAAVLPVPGVDCDHPVEGLGERRYAKRGAASGIVALDDAAGHGEGDHRVAAEADAGGLTVDADALRPALGEAAVRGAADQEAEAEASAPIAVAAGDIDGSDEGCGEHFGSFHQFPLLVRLQELFEMECGPVTRRYPIILFYQKVKRVL